MNFVMSLFMVALLFLGGCGRKKNTNQSKETMKAAFLETDSRSSEMEFAQSDVADIDADVERERDLDEDDMDLAFLDDEDFADDENFDLAENNDDMDLDDRDFDDEDAREEGIQAPHSLNFAINNNLPDEDQEEVLAEQVEFARHAIEEGHEITVQGHTCELGPKDFNLSLSVKRAQFVKDKLVAAGLPAEKINTLACGSEMPLYYSDGTTRSEVVEDLAPNRRAEIVVS